MTIEDLLIGISAEGKSVSLNPAMANRHGLIAGATGTGKTVTLQVLTEAFSKIGVPVFTADVKGDLAGLSKPCILNDRLKARLERLKIVNFTPQANPTIFWDIFSKAGIAVRTTVSEVGPLLMGRMLDLNETQDQVLQLAFKVADEEGLLLLDLKDLRELFNWIGENASELKNNYGNFAPSTIGTIQRSILNLSSAGGDVFFGEPALDISHLQQVDFSGQGVISVLDATQLLADTRLYSTFLLWLLSELFEEMPEVGDLDKPKMVFFFDEAHLLFKDAPASLVERIEKVVRLIRSKGVGVYFVTQNPLDIPQSVLAQLGNRVQHALRAFTPQDQKAVRTAAQTFRANPKLDTEKVITELEVGEALVSVLDSQGRPTEVEKILIIAPRSRIGPITAEERSELISRSPIRSTYEKSIDRESAFEILKARARAKEASEAEAKKESEDKDSGFFGSIFGSGSKSGKRQGVGEAMVKSVVRSFGSRLGREILRGIMGSISGGRRM